MSNNKPSYERRNHQININLTDEEYAIMKRIMDKAGYKRPTKFFIDIMKRVYNSKSFNEDWATQQLVYLQREKDRLKSLIEELQGWMEETEEQSEVLDGVVDDE